MNIPKIISAGLVGTSMMTLFSYLVSEKKNKQFKEPVLLSTLLGKGGSLGTSLNGSKENTLDGWVVHYAVGFFFATIYDQIWTKHKSTPTISSGLILGGVNGAIAVGVWKATFELHPNPPKIEYKKYFGHLVVAHLVFGAFSALGYRFIKEGKSK